jgi:hypothetical protein
LKEKGKGGAVQWGKEKKWQAALLQIDVEKDRRMWLLKLERNRSQDLLVAVGKKRKFERGDCWWGIAAGCGLGTIRKLATLIRFGFEREKWLLATLHLAWERKELNQWLASIGRKKDQREGSSTVKGGWSLLLRWTENRKERKVEWRRLSAAARGRRLVVWPQRRAW